MTDELEELIEKIKVGALVFGAVLSFANWGVTIYKEYRISKENNKEYEHKKKEHEHKKYGDIQKVIDELMKEFDSPNCSEERKVTIQEQLHRLKKKQYEYYAA